jgi:hypothetical protein
MNRKKIMIIKTLLKYHPDVFNFMFSEQFETLTTTPEYLLLAIEGLSKGERLLARIALDLWNKSGRVHLVEPLETLDPQNYSSFVMALGLTHIL